MWRVTRGAALLRVSRVQLVYLLVPDRDGAQRGEAENEAHVEEHLEQHLRHVRVDLAVWM